MKENKRAAGVLMHISSLPGGFGIGDFGSSAYRFAEESASAGFRYWQMLPLFPTGYGNSPYSSLSAFAGNELLVSPELLRDKGLLKDEELYEAKKAFEGTDPEKTDFNKARAVKMPLLRKAASRALERLSFRKDLSLFCERSAYWLEDYALYSVLYNKYSDARWYSVWDEKLGKRDPAALEKARAEYADEIEICKAVQFFFNTQCRALQGFLHQKGLLSIGDIPIFVGMDSADTWSRTELFKTDGEGHFTEVSGVPPDNFSPDGQLWGTPVYDWDYHIKTGFSWWVRRLQRTLELNDIVRIDHFRGFDAYYAIPAGAENARNGVWKHSPGIELFKTLKAELGEDLPIIAEDLGNITKDVIALRKSNGFPGMKISQFGFELKKNGTLSKTADFLPENYSRNFVAYTGTHDNDTTRGWFRSLDAKYKKAVLEYLNTDRKGVVTALVKCIMESRADTVVVPMQDILELGTKARMNCPSTCNDENWSWRMKEGAFTRSLIEKYRKMISASNRQK